MSTLEIVSIQGPAGSVPEFPQSLNVRGKLLVDANDELALLPAGAAAIVAAGDLHHMKGADGIWRGFLLQGSIVVAMSNADIVLTKSEFNNNSFEVDGVLTANVSLIMPLGEPQSFIVDNKTTGPFTLTVKNSAGDTGATVAQNVSMMLYSNGIVIEAVQAQASSHSHPTSDVTGFGSAVDARIARETVSGTAGLNADSEVIKLPAGAAAAAIIDPTYALQADGTWGAVGGGILGKLNIGEVLPQGTWGGAVNQLLETVVPFNTVYENTITGGGLQANQILLPAGAFVISHLSPSITGGITGQVLLYDVTGGGNTLLMHETYYTQAASVGRRITAFIGRNIVLAVPSILELRVYIQQNVGAASLGYRTNRIGFTENFATGEIVQVA